jgi:hypothetical protein
MASGFGFSNNHEVFTIKAVLSNNTTYSLPFMHDFDEKYVDVNGSVNETGVKYLQSKYYFLQNITEVKIVCNNIYMLCSLFYTKSDFRNSVTFVSFNTRITGSNISRIFNPLHLNLFGTLTEDGYKLIFGDKLYTSNHIQITNYQNMIKLYLDYCFEKYDEKEGRVIMNENTASSAQAKVISNFSFMTYVSCSNDQVANPKTPERKHKADEQICPDAPKKSKKTVKN